MADYFSFNIIMNPLDQITVYSQVIQELYNKFLNQDRHITFSKLNTTFRDHSDYHDFHEAFNFFLKSKYALVTTIKERIYGTNRVFYYIYKDSENNDLRVINEKYGCFHGYKTYLSLENIETKISECQKEIAEHDQYYGEGSSYHKYPLAGLQQVKEIYASLLAKNNI